jgi:hypothetical protein
MPYADSFILKMAQINGIYEREVGFMEFSSRNQGMADLFSARCNNKLM